MIWSTSQSLLSPYLSLYGILALSQEFRILLLATDGRLTRAFIWSLKSAAVGLLIYTDNS